LGKALYPFGKSLVSLFDPKDFVQAAFVFVWEISVSCKRFLMTPRSLENKQAIK